VSTDGFPGTTWEGTVEVVDAEVDIGTRNFTVRVLVNNPEGKLRTGMFVDVRVVQPEARELLAIPASSVLFAPYGDSVYVVKERDAEGGEKQQIVEQVFVRLGEHRGDLIAVSSGLQAGDVVVSTGGFKLQSGMAVTIRNDLAPEVNTNPSPPNE